MAPLIEVQDLTVVRDERVILGPLSFTIRRGEHVAVLGPNGSGKSTLLRALSREIHSYAGRGMVRICGSDSWTIAELRSTLGLVSCERRTLLGRPTVLQMALSGLLGTYGVTAQHDVTSAMVVRAEAALDKVGVLNLGDRLVETLSTGERQRTMLARALAPDPIGLVLDEPTSGLDFVAAQGFHELVRTLCDSVTVILVTHHLEEILPEIGRVIVLKEGRVLQDGPRHRVLTPDTIRGAFGVRDPGTMSALKLRLDALRVAHGAGAEANCKAP